MLRHAKVKIAKVRFKIGFTLNVVLKQGDLCAPLASMLRTTLVRTTAQAKAHTRLVHTAAQRNGFT